MASPWIAEPTPKGLRNLAQGWDNPGYVVTLPIRLRVLRTPGHETVPIEVTDKDVGLVVNLGNIQQNRSWMEVEVLDAEKDEVLPGFERESCVDVCRDDVCVPVKWKTTSLRSLDRSQIRLRFHLYGTARLYAFGFDPA